MKHYPYSVPKDVIGHKLIEIARDNQNIVVLSSDVSVSTNVEMFRKEYPERFFELGIAEQSTMSIAGGFASEGFVPVYVALAIFSNGMTWAQTRQVCNAGLNVKIIGTHAGVDDGQDGSGHHATEDIAISRVLPGMTVLSPSDKYEVAAAIEAMVHHAGPVYMRVAREEQPVIHREDCTFPIGKAEVLKDTGDDFAVVFEGSALKQALEGFELACSRGKKGKLVSVRTIKPIDRECIHELADSVDTIVVVENHSVLGGLYSTICESLAGKRTRAVIKSVGFLDKFAESGSSKDIKEKYGLSAEQVVKAME